jgi:hypothetical protein
VHPILGRYHGFSTTGLTIAEFAKIIQSLHTIRRYGRLPIAPPPLSVAAPVPEIAIG